jgi:hypothetical protein
MGFPIACCASMFEHFYIGNMEKLVFFPLLNFFNQTIHIAVCHFVNAITRHFV